MNFSKKNLKLLACPVCKNNLEIKFVEEAKNEIISGSLICCFCKQNFEIRNGVLHLLPEIFSQINKYKQWEEKQKDGLIDYQNPDLDYKRHIALIKKMFEIFCEHQGIVLDIGCGINPKLNYFDKEINKEVNFIGLDPLLGSKEREFCFLRGIGEYLPFLDKTIDQIIIAGTLDHFINPLLVLKEAKRVLKKDGEINVWITIFDPDYERKIDLIKRAVNLIKKGNFRRLIKNIKEYDKEILPDSEDKYHFNRFRKKDIVSMFDELKMEIKHSIILFEGNKYLFLKVKK